MSAAKCQSSATYPAHVLVLHNFHLHLHSAIHSRYIEEELNKKKNSKLQNDGSADNDEYDEKYLSPEEAALLSLPEHLRVSSAHRSEEMLSNQMLNGIPEVDLGIDVKIKNIEATEAAKEKLLRDQKNKKVQFWLEKIKIQQTNTHTRT